MNKQVFIFCFYLLLYGVKGQENVDSLVKEARSSINDIHSRAMANSALAKRYLYRDADSAMLYARRALQLAHKASDTRIMGEASRRLGAIHQLYGLIDSAKYFTNLALQWSTEARDTIGISSAYLNLGNIMDRLGKFPEEIEMNRKSAEWASLMRDNLGLAYALANIGNAYQKMEFFDKAIEFHLAGLAKAETEGDIQLIANSHNNLGISYSKIGAYPKSNEEYRKAEKMYREQEEEVLRAQVITNIAGNHEQMGEHLVAKELFLQSIAINKQAENSYGTATALNGLGHVYMNIGKHDSALIVLKESIKQFASNGSHDGIVNSRALIADVYFDLKKYNLCIKENLANIPDAIKENQIGTLRDTYSQMAVIYRILKQPEKALGYMEKFIAYRDSIDNDESKRSIMRSEMKFEYEKKAAADSVRAGEEKKIVTAKLKQELTQRRMLYGGLTLVGLFAIFMVNRFMVANRQKKIIDEQRKQVEHQKLVVEEKQKEILDSIYYARRIQRSLISSELYIQKCLTRLNKS